MQSTGSVKVGAAFLAGIIVALGGALIYFRVSDAHAQPPAQVMTTDAAVEQPVETPPTPPKSTDKTATAQLTTAGQPAISQAPIKKAAAAAKIRMTSRPVSLAVWHPKTQPVQGPITQTLPAPVDAPPPVDETVTRPPATLQPATAQPIFPTQPHVVTIPAGTSLAVRLNEKLSTDQSFTGDTFRATLDSPIIMEGFIIADRGAKVLGRVAKSQKPGRMQGMAELSLVLTEISTTDGQRVTVDTNESLRKGPSNTSEEVVKMAGGAALGAIIGAIAGGGKGAAIGAGAGGAAGTGAVLLGHGKPAVVENETRLMFELARPTTITEHLN